MWVNDLEELLRCNWLLLAWARIEDMAGGAREDRGLYWSSAGLVGGSGVPDGFNDDAMPALSARLGADRLLLCVDSSEGKDALL
jgi:hypothetical protein